MVQMGLWRRWREVFDVVVANSRALAGRLEEEGIEPVQVIPNGVPIRPARTQLARSPTILYAGRLVPEKGVDVLMRAFARVVNDVPDARLAVVGGGEAASLRRLALELGVLDSVELTGPLQREEMERRFEGAWVQAVPSLWEEPFGNVAVEAMMRGTAVVASASGGLTEIVDERSGMLVPPGDPGLLADALVRILSAPELAESLGAAGRAIAIERFSEQRFVEANLSMYRALIAGRAPTAIS
jgi:glycosyltransferase involved in cell wall biosynthesis